MHVRRLPLPPGLLPAGTAHSLLAARSVTGLVATGLALGPHHAPEGWTHGAAPVRPAPDPLLDTALARLLGLLTHPRAAVPPLLLPLDLTGPAFTVHVWRTLQRIPTGTSLTVAQVADMSGRPLAMSAVRHAIAWNPLPLLIPCHRVVPDEGGLGEYRWGRDLKAWLLAAEGVDVTDLLRRRPEPAGVPAPPRPRRSARPLRLVAAAPLAAS